jgi:hypothetical protein
VITSAGYLIDNHGPEELWTYNAHSKGITNATMVNTIMVSKLIVTVL